VLDLPPLARFGDRVATGLTDVTSDPAALDSTGFWAVAADFEGRLTCARFTDVREEPVPAPVPGAWRGPAAGDWTSSLDRAAYTAGVRRIREHIAAGEVYQANLCRVLSAPIAPGADVDALTALLARGNPAPYAGTIRLPEHGVEIATASPELYLRREGRTVESGPIKGTGRTEADLLEKDYAENVMIVDLVRNDIGRVCATGSVTVPDLCVVEKHPGLVHLVSTVRGELRPEAGWPELLAATFPPGSVTGAPKSSALRIIDALETAPRGPYCAGSTPTGARASWPSASAPSGSTGPTTARACCGSAPAPGSPGGPTRRGSGGRPS
jgi:para-aminobenzoate synthetase component 1